MAKAQLRKKSGIHAFDVVNYLVFIIISLIKPLLINLVLSFLLFCLYIALNE